MEIRRLKKKEEMNDERKICEGIRGMLGTGGIAAASMRVGL